MFGVMTQCIPCPVVGSRLKRLAFILTVIVGGNGLYAQANESRVWTDAQGRTVRASMVSTSGDQVVLQLESGAQSAVSVATLSPQDQAYIRAFSQAPAMPPVTAPAATPAATPGVTMDLAWPQETITVVPKSIEVTPGVQSDETRRYHYQSGSFEFISFAPLAGTVITAVAADFELIKTAVTHLPWGWEPKPRDGGRFKIYLTETEADYLEMGGSDNTSGFTKDGKSYIKFSSLGLKKVGTRYAFDARQKEPGRVVGMTLREMMWDKRGLMYPWTASGLENLMQHVAYQDNGTVRFTGLETSIKKAIKERSGSKAEPDVTRLLRRLRQDWSVDRGNSNQFLIEDHLDSMMLMYYFGFLDGDGSGAALHAYFRDIGLSIARKDFRNYRDKGTELMNTLLAGRDDATLAEEIRQKYRSIGIKL